jgi:hypothetical protein
MLSFDIKYQVIDQSIFNLKDLELYKIQITIPYEKSFAKVKKVVIESILANLMGKNHKDSFALSSIKIKNGSVYEEIKDNGHIDMFAHAHLLLRGTTKESTLKTMETET